MANVRRSVDTWMMEAYVSPWRAWVKDKRGRGEMVRVDDVWVDVPNVISRPYTCDSNTCSPGLRKRGHSSCCAELSVEITPREIKERLQPHFEGVSRFLAARDPAWAKRPRTVEDCVTNDEDNRFQLSLAKRDKRCVFSFKDEAGAILCGIHGYALQEGLDRFALKPVLCSIFPMVLVDLADGTVVLSCLDEENGPLIGFDAFDELPCLHGERTFGALEDGAPAFYASMRDTLAHILGKRFVAHLDALAHERGRSGERAPLVPITSKKRARAALQRSR